jgi:hypothetical protein
VKPAVLTKIYCGFTQSLLANFGYHNDITAYSFQIVSTDTMIGLFVSKINLFEMKYFSKIYSASAGFLSPVCIVQTVSGAHLASYPMGTRAPSDKAKRLEHEADQSPPTSAEVKNAWIHASIFHSIYGVVLN